MAKVQPVTIKNAAVWNGHTSEQRDLYFDERVLALPAPDALTIDLDGYTIFPGMVNAHDHLELNHYPRTKFREKYDNAHQWGEDVNARLNTEPYKSLRAYPLWDRCFIGGLKNLLCGATTVAHHGPPHKPLFRKNFPVRVLKKYGWAHSLHFSTDAEIIESYRNTPHSAPWFIHLAEGTDEIAKSEYEKLVYLGCFDCNTTVLVHCTALFQREPNFKLESHRGVVWCPSTNAYLLGDESVPDGDHLHRLKENAMAVGSDSRLTANGDLLDELNFVYSKLKNQSGNMIWLTRMVFDEGGFILFHQHNPDWLSIQPFADFFLLHTNQDDATNLCTASRNAIQLIIRGGNPQIGDTELMAKFPHIETVPATLDGVPKAVNIDLARQIARCMLAEPGLELLETPRKALFRGVFSR